MKNNNRVTLKDVYNAINRLEDKMDRRLIRVETKVDTLETFRDNLAPKIAFIVGGLSLLFTVIWEWTREKLNLK